MSGAGAGGRSGAGGNAAGASGGSGGVVDVSSPQCVSCEQQSTICQPRRMTCETLEGEALAGPGAGELKRDLCIKVLNCVRESKCVQKVRVNDMDSYLEVACLCGDVSTPDKVDACLASTAPQGVCKDVIAAGAETTMTVDVAARFTDPTYATGAAFSLVQCDKRVCAKSCGLCDSSDPACTDGPAPMGAGGMSGGAGAGGQGGAG